VSCTGMPLYETDGSGNSGAGRVTHEVLHGGANPSYVLAPLIPSGVHDAACVDMSEDFVDKLSAGVFPA
jgi:hypothetical protein